MVLTLYTGSLLHMVPYFAMARVTYALFMLIGIMFIVLLVFGYTKNYVTIRSRKAGYYGAVQTLFLGAVAAGVSYGIIRALDQHDFAGT
jgi:vacuolar iron transporter family protein